MKNLLSERILVGPALVPQTVNAAATANGATIPESVLKKGRLIGLILMAASLNSVTVLKVKVQGLLRSDGTTWEDYVDKDGTNVLQYTAAKTIDNAALENGVLLGTLDLTRIPSKYSALRLVVATVTGANVTLSAAYVISDLYKLPSGQDEDLYYKQLPYTA